MDVYVYSDGLGGLFAYRSLSDFIRSGKRVELDASERTLRGVFSDGDVYVQSCVPNRWLRCIEVEERVRKKVRPKYLFGKPY